MACHERIVLARVGGSPKISESRGFAPVTPASYKGLFSDPNLWRLTAFYFLFQVGDIGFMMWLPTILKGLTNQGMTVIGFLSALPFFAAMAGLYLIAYFSDRSG